MARYEYNGKSYFSISHYAEINAVTKKTIYAWLKSGKLESTKIGSTTFVRLKN